MKFTKILFSVLAILLALGVSVTAIGFAAHTNSIDVVLAEPDSFETPVNRGDFFNGADTVSQSPTDFSRDLNMYFTEAPTEPPTTKEATTQPPTTEAPTEPEPTTEAIIFPPDMSANHYNDSPFITVGCDYFDDAVFIGNSRLQGFILYSKVPDLRSYTYVGLSVKTYFSKDGFTVDGKSVTAAQALEMDPDFKKVYLKFGINELGWVSNEQFKQSYSEILDHIYSINPNAIVYLHSVLPVSEYAIKQDPTLDNQKIFEYNQEIMNLASEYGACYLDVASVFTGEDGSMPYELSFDGVHLNVGSVKLWLDYLLGHGIEYN